MRLTLLPADILSLTNSFCNTLLENTDGNAFLELAETKPEPMCDDISQGRLADEAC